jgi:hypothetical protein
MIYGVSEKLKFAIVLVRSSSQFDLCADGVADNATESETIRLYVRLWEQAGCAWDLSQIPHLKLRCAGGPKTSTGGQRHSGVQNRGGAAALWI